MNPSRARCTNHEGRQASGICPSCARPFCRECLTEHAGRLSCAECLRRSAPAARRQRAWHGRIAAPAMLIAALLLSWFLFYALGSTLELMTAPDSPHTPAQGERL